MGVIPTHRGAAKERTRLCARAKRASCAEVYLSLAYTDLLAELGIAPSVGSRGDSYDNALAEAVNAAYKTELINHGRPWRCIDDVELSTAEWVAWYNQERLHEASAT